MTFARMPSKDATLPNCAFALLEFDRRTTMCDYFMPTFEVNITSGAASGVAALDEHRRVSFGARHLEPSHGGVDLSPLVVGPRVSCSGEWKPVKAGVQRRVLHPLWGFKTRLRPLVYSGMNDVGAIAQPLGWPLLRLLVASPAARRHVLAAPNSSRLYSMLCRYLVSPNAPHKSFVARCLTLLLAAHSVLPGSPLARPGACAGAVDDSEGVTAPDWDMDHLLVLHQGMIQRVHAFKLKLGFHAASPYFRAVLNIGIMSKPVVRAACAGAWR